MKKPRRKPRNRPAHAETRRAQRGSFAILARAQSRVWLRFSTGNDYFDLMSFAERCILADASAGFANAPFRGIGNS